MATNSDQSERERSLRQAVSAALQAIPVVRVKKIRETIQNDVVVSFRETIRDISLSSLIAIMRESCPNLEFHPESLLGILLILETMGIVEISRQLGEARVSATSEAASSLVQNLINYIRVYPSRVSPIRHDSSVKPFRAIVEDHIEKDSFNPHLVLANLFAFDSNRMKDKPLFDLRIISVLIKGERPKADSEKESEAVYLHVLKPEWGKYALIGSRQSENQIDQDAARLALDEDLVTLATSFDLKPSGVMDVHETTPEIKLGLNTRHSFNLCIVDAIHDELRGRNDLKYAWFTYDEIQKGMSKKGDQIMTRAELFDRINDSIGLNSIPVVVRNIGEFPTQSFRSELIGVEKLYASAVNASARFVLRLCRRMWSLRWWLLFIPAMIGLYLALTPILDRNIPALANMSSIIGIVAFILYVAGVIRNSYRRNEKAKKE